MSGNDNLIRDLLEKKIYQEIPPMDEGDYYLQFGNDAPPYKKGMTFADMLVHRLLMKACAGNDKSIQEVLDRFLGKPKQKTDEGPSKGTYLDFLQGIVEKDKPSEKDIFS